MLLILMVSIEISNVLPKNTTQGQGLSLDISFSNPTMSPRLFSNALIVHQVKTEKITTVKEVWIPGLNLHRF